MFLIKLTAWLAIITTLTGCSKPEGQDLLENYLYRISNAIDHHIDNDLDTLPAIIKYPDRRARLAPVEPLRLSITDTLQLSKCNLLTIIAERNSSLGKVMLPSQMLSYELRFFSAIQTCLTTPSNHLPAELTLQLKEIRDHKWDNLPAVAWNAIYNSSAMEDNFSLSSEPLSPDADHILAPSLEALRYFSNINSQLLSKNNFKLPSNLDNLENHYKALAHTKLGAQWLSAIRLLTETLIRASDALKARLNKSIICLQNKPTPQAKIIKNVFSKYYIRQVQPYMALIDNIGRNWLLQHQQLLNQLTHAARLNQYRLEVLSIEGKLWQKYIEARTNHTKQWQKLLRQCNMMPK